MKENKINFGSWQSSRFTLPEHKEAISNNRDSLRRKEKPILDENQLRQICIRVQESMLDKKVISILVNGEYEYQGVVECIDQLQRRLKIGDKWVWFEDIVHVI